MEKLGALIAIGCLLIGILSMIGGAFAASLEMEIKALVLAGLMVSLACVNLLGIIVVRGNK
jgi:hypothetical protein